MKFITYACYCETAIKSKTCWHGKEQLKNQRSTSWLSSICDMCMLNAVPLEKKISYRVYVRYDQNHCD